MIDKETGALTIADGCVIRPGLAKAACTALWESGPCRVLHARGASAYLGSSYRAQFADPRGRLLVLTVDFENDAVARLGLLFLLPREDEAGSPTAEWTEANERQRQALHDALLQEALGDPPYTYPWGRVISVYDGRSGFSEIRVLYTP